ncbi:transcriptional regulator [Chelatococcus asaccharovorans]|uniref:transcriptional regulator n=1 Tax=Chelatococcus asaccharovorans TaxID=28210 RepID=UPI00224C71E0|nr:transcriptional regulator [Chelatococcus asaccharovorans]CAH1663026.1 TolB-like protein [Chelatococcus asaccharovorans]CAH1682999.1 TolB-like protein [Chelatococcus asaccharovorans]
MESQGSVAPPSKRGLEIRLLGPPLLLRDGVPMRLPPSRKMLALLAYLAVDPHPVARGRLCELLWEIPNDPRGELRWCLSKLRSLLDGANRPRVLTAQDRVALDLGDCDVDVTRLAGATRAGLETLVDSELRALADSCSGDLLEGIELGHSLEFERWLAGRRSEFRSHFIDVIAEVGRRTPVGTPEGLSAARRWLEFSPLDAQAHARFLTELYHRRMLDACAKHLDGAAKTFAVAGVEFAPVRAAWAEIRGASIRLAAAAVREPLREQALSPQAGSRRASIAVMPFWERLAGAMVRSDLGNALAHDIISRLARLRSLFVIARGSVFAIADDGLGLKEIGNRLGVDYVATGFLEQHETVIAVAAEVAEAATARLVWTERFEARSPEPLSVLDDIGDGIVSSIAAEIENAERNRAVLKHPGSLDAWEAYHCGLWHMYRFTIEENARAAEFFRMSIRLDPTFSRAHAGLSFTHWQNAFQRWGDRTGEARQALEAAGQSLLVDDHNPAAHWSMGRALWLMGDLDEAVRELERSIHLSPNFALGHYALSFVHSQSGDPAAAIASSDHSRLLSPCDPLLFGMLGTRAMALIRLGAFEEAAEWGGKAAARPNAHIHILGIAACCLALAGRIDEARNHVARIRLQNPRYRIDDLLDTFRFDQDAVARYRNAAALIGLVG